MYLSNLIVYLNVLNMRVPCRVCVRVVHNFNSVGINIKISDSMAFKFKALTFKVFFKLSHRSTKTCFFLIDVFVKAILY